MRILVRAGCRATLFLAGIIAFAPVLAAQDTVRVNGQIKKTTGVVVSLDAGDVACYITLRDDRGKEFEELGEFEICENDGLVGKRVVLTYRVGEVMADECEGDPECEDTRTVALVRSVRVAPRAPATVPAAPSGGPAGSLCAGTETVVFSCRTGDKVVSVCTSKGAAAGRGWMQYRFGKPGSREPLDLVLPRGAMTPGIAATGENVPFAGGGGSWLRFRNGSYSYVVYSGIGRWGPNGEPREKQGMVIESSGKMVTNLPCVGGLIDKLGPEWFESHGVGTRLDDFLFP